MSDSIGDAGHVYQGGCCPWGNTHGPLGTFAAMAAHASPRQPMPAHASSPPHRSQRHSARKNYVALPCTAQAPPRCRSVLPTLYPPALLPALLPAQPHCSLAVAPRCHVNTQVAPSMSCLCMVVLARQTHKGHGICATIAEPRRTAAGTA
jgi:hypothetical protein